MIQDYKNKYNKLVNNLVDATNNNLISENVMYKTLQLVNTGTDQKLVDFILNDGGKKIIKSYSKEAIWTNTR